MKTWEFAALCAEACVLPDLALENEKIRAALAAGNDKLVKKLIREEF